MPQISLAKSSAKFAQLTPCCLLVIGLCAGALLGMTAVATAAPDRATIAAAEKKYKAARAACLAGQSHQDRPTCLKEAGAALEEARRGNLTSAESADYEKNRLLRCQNQPAETRDLCVRRMQGGGVVSGSVEGGGVLRELTVIETGPAVLVPR